MKKIFVLVVGLLLIGVNLYAAGDLIVNGKLGVGTSTFTSKITTQTTNESVMELTVTKNSSAFVRPALLLNFEGNDTNAGASAFSMIARANNSAATTGNMNGGAFNSYLMGAGTVNNVTGLANVLLFGSSGVGGYNVSGQMAANRVELWLGASNTQTHTVSNYYGYLSRGFVIGSGSLSGTNWYHGYFDDFPDYGGTITKVAGLWINKQTRGTTNYGIVLNGDGAGADIVFGTTQQAKIYANAGELFAKDGAGNVTQISPHDPDTGEWIYYSKNTKTGIVKRVSMEKLVKAVEKLTGETFMMETLTEDK